MPVTNCRAGRGLEVPRGRARTCGRSPSNTYRTSLGEGLRRRRTRPDTRFPLQQRLRSMCAAARSSGLGGSEPGVAPKCCEFTCHFRSGSGARLHGQAACACLNAGDWVSSPLSETVLPPLGRNFGSGKFGTPWDRMHFAFVIAASRSLAEAGEPCAVLAGCSDGTPGGLTGTRATAYRCPRGRSRRGGGRGTSAPRVSACSPRT